MRRPPLLLAFASLLTTCTDTDPVVPTTDHSDQLLAALGMASDPAYSVILSPTATFLPPGAATQFTATVLNGTDDGKRAYYYGAVIPPAGSPYGGVGYVGYPASVGALWAITHEIGHNMNLLHAPCGGPRNVDPDYPYEDGHIGQGGFDFVLEQTLKDPAVQYDVMSYCHPRWISDYHFNKALTYRLEQESKWWDADADLKPPRIIVDPMPPGWRDSAHERR